jgi:hypothetical protein
MPTLNCQTRSKGGEDSSAKIEGETWVVSSWVMDRLQTKSVCFKLFSFGLTRAREGGKNPRAHQRGDYGDRAGDV